MKPILFVIVLLVNAIVAAVAQQSEGERVAAKEKAATSGELFDTVARMDSAIFDAFNAHDIDRLMALFTNDLEFYNDGGGVTDHQQSKLAFAKMFANNPDIRRELVPGSLKVYPLKDYGAIEVGEHRFCHTEKGEGAKPAQTECGTFSFAMVWRKAGDRWQLSRVLSYGH
jgi:ketosteroid isomerase-like protein